MSKRTWKVCAKTGSDSECNGRTSVISAKCCHLCGGSLVYEIDGEPVNTDDLDPNIDTDISDSDSSPNWLKTKLGGITMNWKAIGFAILAIGLFAYFVLNYKLLSVSTWGIVALVGIVALFLANIIAFTKEIKPTFGHTRTMNFFYTIGSFLLMLAIIFGLLFPNLIKPAIENQTFVPGATTKPEVFSLGKPADPKDVDPTVWKQPLKGAVMIDGNGIVYYTQSGKNDSKLLKGQIPAGQTLVLDSYALSKQVNDKLESYSGGNLLAVVGPLDLDKNPISYTDGAAQMIGTTELQNFLDENIWVKFSRGDSLPDHSAWSYKPLALSNIWLPDGYTFKELGLTAKTDTYPNKIPPTK